MVSPVHGGNASRPKLRFVCTLATGCGLSATWFAVHYHMTQVHSLDSGIINFSGRLRFLTQHVGLIALQKMQSESEQQERSSELEETFQQIESTCMQLLGEIGTIQSGGAPEMLDEDVKESLRKWMNDGLVPLRRLVSAGLDISDRSSVIAAVNSASDTVDSVVDSAEEASHGRVRVLLALSISRACVGVVWALVVTVCAFSDVWRSYIRTYNLLQAAEQQRTSLMRAAFDAVIKVQPAGPFHITEDSRELCHILGQPVQGKSLIDFAGQTEEQEKLREFFEREIRRPARRTSPFSLDLWWWNLAPGGPASDLPVAPMICTRLLCGERSDRELGMEILVVGSTSCDFNADKYAALLAVRVVPCSPSSTPRRYPVAELPMHEEASDTQRFAATRPDMPAAGRGSKAASPQAGSPTGAGILGGPSSLPSRICRGAFRQSSASSRAVLGAAPEGPSEGSETVPWALEES